MPRRLFSRAVRAFLHHLQAVPSSFGGQPAPVVAETSASLGITGEMN
jgi:hypothetical protein